MKIKGIKECTVQISQNNLNERFLIAYYSSDLEMSTSKLKYELSKSLPEYMIPSYFYEVKRIPRNFSGKINTDELSRSIHASSIKNVILPKNQLEIKVYNIFKTVFPHLEISMDDDFFDIGGHSILAIKLMFLLEKEEIKTVTVEVIFRCRTISNLIKFIEEGYEDAEQETGDYQLLENISKSTTIISGINPYNKFYYKSCYYNALLPALIMFGISDKDIFISDIPTYKIKNAENYLGLETYKIFDLRDELSRYGINLEKIQIRNDFISPIIESIREGSPVIVQIDCFYNPLRKDTFNQLHWEHNLLVYGYDEITEEFIVLEHSDRDMLDYSERRITFYDLERSVREGIKQFGDENTIEPPFIKITKKQPQTNEFSNSNLEKFQLTLKNNYLLLSSNINELNQFLEKIYEDKVKSLISEDTENKILDSVNRIIESKRVEVYKYDYVFKSETINKQSSLVLTEWEQFRIFLYRNHLYYNPKIFKDKYHSYLKKIIKNELELFDQFKRF